MKGIQACNSGSHQVLISPFVSFVSFSSITSSRRSWSSKPKDTACNSGSSRGRDQGGEVSHFENANTTKWIKRISSRIPLSCMHQSSRQMPQWGAKKSSNNRVDREVRIGKGSGGPRFSPWLGPIWFEAKPCHTLPLLSLVEFDQVSSCLVVATNSGKILFLLARTHVSVTIKNVARLS